MLGTAVSFYFPRFYASLVVFGPSFCRERAAHDEIEIGIREMRDPLREYFIRVILLERLFQK